MTDSMVERVAEAIKDARAGKLEVEEWGDAAFQRAARAAIEAMREPTQAMYEAGFDHANRTDGNATARGYYDAMIDAALAEPK